jgi:hypothetical protein
LSSPQSHILRVLISTFEVVTFVYYLRSTAGIVLKIQHGLGDIITGYEINFILESNFKINTDENEHSTSYIWRSIQKENILFKIEYEDKFVFKSKFLFIHSKDK